MTYDPSIARRIELAKLAEADDRKLDPLPPPEIPGRRVSWYDVDRDGPNAAATRWSAAEEAGWTVDSCFSRGPLIGADGQPLDTADMLTLGFRWEDHGPPELVVSWIRRTGKRWEFDHAWIYNPGALPTSIGGNDIGHWLAGTAPKKKETAP